jgi:hypothetical protein
VGPQFRFDQFNLLQIGQPRGHVKFSGQFIQLRLWAMAAVMGWLTCFWVSQ